MSSISHQPQVRIVGRSIRSAPLDTVRSLAMSAQQNALAQDANEWYWVMRFNHTLYRTIRWGTFLNWEWRYARDLTSDEIATLTPGDLTVLALSESAAAREVAAESPFTPPSSLSALAKDRERSVYRAAGHNPATPAQAIAFMRSSNRTDGISAERLQFLWTELSTFERIDNDLALEVARGFHGDEYRIALARRGHDTGGALTELAGYFSLPAEAAALLVDHPAVDVRLALAKNRAPGVGEDLLVRLAEDSSRDVRRAIAANPNLPEAAALQLLKDPAIKSTVIAESSLSPQTLAALEKDPNTRRQLIDRLDANREGWGRSKHGTPPDEFVELLRELAESPNEHTRIAVARHAAAPLDLLEKLAEDESLAGSVSNGFGTVIANNHFSDGHQFGAVGWYKRYLSSEDLEFLAASASSVLRAARAQRYVENDTELERLAQDPHPSVRAAAAESEWIATRELCALADDDDERVRAAATKTIRRLIQKLQAPSEQWSGEWLRKQTDLPAYFPRSWDGGVDMTLMRRVFLPGQHRWSPSSDDLDLLARCKSTGIRAAVAAFSGRKDDPDSRWHWGPDLHPQTLQSLLTDEDDEVREAAFTNVGRAALLVAASKDAPTEALIHYARSANEAIRGAVASNSATPGPVLANLARDGEDSVRMAVAKNSATPVAALATLTRDRSEDVLLELMENPAVPTEFLVQQVNRAADYRESERQLRLARNPNSPAEVLRKLGYSNRGDIRELVAKHPSVPADTLEILSFDENVRVRDTAVRHREGEGA